jgi:prolipoprotein diacylglyceryl transferase
MELAYIPSPSRSVIHLGPIPLRGYAFCIILGVFVAVWLANRRWVARGGQPGTVGDIAVWAVLFGLVGGRLYHVITTYEPYFGKGGHPVDALKIWEGGLGIWGAIALGALGAWIGCRRRGVPLPAYADAAAPGIVLAQAVGRWGNWFNQELYGKPTTVPWALKISEDKRPANSLDAATYHPTFLYESLWCVGVALLVLWADRRFKLGHGRAFALYVAAYTVGRAWIEYLRVDEAHHILGLRLNDWTSMIVFVLAVGYLVVSHRKRPGREEIVEPTAEQLAAAKAGGGPAAAVAGDVVAGTAGDGKALDGKSPDGKVALEKAGAGKAAADNKVADNKVADNKVADGKAGNGTAGDGAVADGEAAGGETVSAPAADGAKAAEGSAAEVTGEDAAAGGADEGVPDARLALDDESDGEVSGEQEATPADTGATTSANGS